MLMRPTGSSRPPFPAPAEGSQLEPCAFCDADNGITAKACWRCGAELLHSRLEGLAMKGKPAGQRPPPAATAAPDPDPATVPIIPTLTIEPPPRQAPAGAASRSADEAALRAAEQAYRATQPRPPPPFSWQPYLRPLAALAGVLIIGGAVLAVTLNGRYQASRIGTGWVPEDPAASPAEPARSASPASAAEPPADWPPPPPLPDLTAPAAPAPEASPAQAPASAAEVVDDDPIAAFATAAPRPKLGGDAVHAHQRRSQRSADQKESLHRLHRTHGGKN